MDIWAAQDTGVEDGGAPGQAMLWSAGKLQQKVSSGWGRVKMGWTQGGLQWAGQLEHTHRQWGRDQEQEGVVQAHCQQEITGGLVHADGQEEVLVLGEEVWEEWTGQAVEGTDWRKRAKDEWAAKETKRGQCSAAGKLA